MPHNATGSACCNANAELEQEGLISVTQTQVVIARAAMACGCSGFLRFPNRMASLLLLGRTVMNTLCMMLRHRHQVKARDPQEATHGAHSSGREWAERCMLCVGRYTLNLHHARHTSLVKTVYSAPATVRASQGVSQNLARRTSGNGSTVGSADSRTHIRTRRHCCWCIASSIASGAASGAAISAHTHSTLDSDYHPNVLFQPGSIGCIQFY